MRKLSEAFKKLPAICRKLSPVKEIVYNFSDVNQTFVIKKNNVESGSVSLTPMIQVLEGYATMLKRLVTICDSSGRHSISLC